MQGHMGHSELALCSAVLSRCFVEGSQRGYLAKLAWGRVHVCGPSVLAMGCRLLFAGLGPSPGGL